MAFIEKIFEKTHFLVPVLFVLTLLIIGYTRIDPDFGYRLKNGELIFQEGPSFFGRTDPYSYTMPSYVFIEHSWLAALLIFILHKYGGFLALSLLWSFVATLALLISLNTSKTKFFQQTPFGSFSNFLVIFVYISTLSIFAVRVQVFSWLFLSLFLYLYFNEQLWRKYKHFTPALFLLWVNMHGSFIAGISVFFLLFLTKTLNINFPKSVSIEEFKKVISNLKLSLNKSDLVVFLLSVAATLINPYGLGIWQKTSKVVTNNELRWEIQEWLPKPFGMKPCEGFYLVFSVFLIIKKRFKISNQKLFLYFAFLFQGLMAARHFQLYLLVSMPITFDALYFVYKDIEKIRFGKKRFFFSLKFLTFFSIIFFVTRIFLFADSLNGVEKNSFYPVEAVNYLKTNLPEGQIFSLYDWGGYLNWKLPEKKVFVNGFMPLWSREVAPEGESVNAYREFVDVFKDKVDYDEVFDKYGVEMVLLPVEKELTWIDKFSKMISEYFGRIFERETPDDLIVRLKEDNWEVVYEDETSLIFRKPH